jgi:uncharacterized protein YegL
MSLTRINSSVFNNYGIGSKGFFVSSTVSCDSIVELPSPIVDLSQVLVSPDITRHFCAVIDVSGSMADSIEKLKLALRTLKKVCGPVFGNQIKLSIITFSFDANVIFSHFGEDGSIDDEAFERAVNSIHKISSTNIGAGLTKAKEHILSVNRQASSDYNSVGYPTWIFMMTDGDPNEGTMQTVSSVAAGVKTLFTDDPQINTTLVTFGFGLYLKPEILATINYTALSQNSEELGEAMSLVALEACRASVMSGTIVMPELPPRDPDAISTPLFSKDAIGTSNFGVITVDSPYTYGVLPFGNTNPSIASSWIGKTVTVNVRLLNGSTETFTSPIIAGGEYAPLSVVLAYVKNSRGKMVVNLNNMKFSGDIQRIKDGYKLYMAEWPTTVEKLQPFKGPVSDVEFASVLLEIQTAVATVERIMENVSDPTLNHMAAQMFSNPLGTYSSPIDYSSLPIGEGLSPFDGMALGRMPSTGLPLSIPISELSRHATIALSPSVEVTSQGVQTHIPPSMGVRDSFIRPGGPMPHQSSTLFMRTSGSIPQSDVEPSSRRRRRVTRPRLTADSAVPFLSFGEPETPL